jgi:hypothetical protein
MGREERVASKKSSRNEGLPLFPTISPAIFMPNNPAQPPARRGLSQHQAAFRQREILAFARFAPRDRPTQPFDGPVEPVPARRMVPPGYRLDQAAEKPCPQPGTETAERRFIERHLAVRLAVDFAPDGTVDLNCIHRCLRQAAFPDRPLPRRTNEVGRPGDACRAQPGPFETPVGI